MNSWIKKDLKYLWHPYTQMKDCQTTPPILIERSKGIKLFDENGKYYYDTISSWWCNIHGHNHPQINAAIKKQLGLLEHVLFAGFTHKPAIELAERLVQITPKNLTKVFFADNGSTANEIAMKMSFQYWRSVGKKTKVKFVSLDAGFHGDTIGAMSVSGVDRFNEFFKPLMFPSYKVSSPYCYRCPMGKCRKDCAIDCIKPFEKILKDHHSEICAMIMEPLVMGAAGMIVYPKEYLSRVAELCRQYEVHLILDEVATGFGRTGKMFACEHAKVQPDFISLSKGITSGYLPMGAVVTTEKIYKAFYADYCERKTFFHGHTYTANPLACAAAIASLKIFEDEKSLDRVQERIVQLQSGLEAMRELPLVGDVRGLGMIGALELVLDKKTKRTFKFEDRVDQQIYIAGLEKNIILRPLGNVLYLFLPFCITKQELAKILNIVRDIVKNLKV